MFNLDFEVASIIDSRLVVIGELMNYKFHVFSHLLARVQAKINLGDVDACKMHP
jgi:hypothetical protein